MWENINIYGKLSCVHVQAADKCQAEMQSELNIMH